MKIIVSGASGFVGRNVVEELLGRGCEVTALTSHPSVWHTFPERAELVKCDMNQYAGMELPDCMRDADMFFHFAWDGTSGEKRYDLRLQLDNVQGTQNAVALARRCGCRRFVFAGSIMEYEASAYIPLEKSEPGLGYLYSAAKLMADYTAKITAQMEGLEYVSLIISNIYGPDETSKRFINGLLENMLSGQPMELTEGRQLYDFIYISDAARAICDAGLRGISGRSYYIGNDEPRPLREFVEMAEEEAGGADLRYGAVAYKGPDLDYSRLDTKRLSRELGFCPEISFREGIQRTMKRMLQRMDRER